MIFRRSRKKLHQRADFLLADAGRGRQLFERCGQQVLDGAAEKCQRQAAVVGQSPVGQRLLEPIRELVVEQLLAQRLKAAHDFVVFHRRNLICLHGSFPPVSRRVLAALRTAPCWSEASYLSYLLKSCIPRAQGERKIARRTSGRGQAKTRTSPPSTGARQTLRQEL